MGLEFGCWALGFVTNLQLRVIVVTMMRATAIVALGSHRETRPSSTLFLHTSMLATSVVQTCWKPSQTTPRHLNLERCDHANKLTAEESVQSAQATSL